MGPRRPRKCVSWRRNFAPACRLRSRPISWTSSGIGTASSSSPTSIPAPAPTSRLPRCSWLICMMACRCGATVLDFHPRGKGSRSYPANRSGILLPDAENKGSRPPNASGVGGTLAFAREEVAMAKINGLCVGESLVGEGNEVAHIDLIMGPRGSAAETAFANCLTNNKDGFTSLLAVIGPNLLTKPATVMFNKVTIKGAKQAVQMFGPAQHAVAKAVADSVAEGVIPQNEADDLFICVGVFIHWEAADDKKIQEYNYKAVKESIARAVAGEPKAAEVVSKRDQVKHPFAA